MIFFDFFNKSDLIMIIVMNKIAKEEHGLNHISSILVKLMSQAGIRKVSDLARYTGIPHSSINKIISGGIDSPKAVTVNKLAIFFGLSIEQLIGEVRIPENWVFGGYNNSRRKAWMIVPIIEWADVMFWVFKHDSITPYNYKHWINTEKDLSEKSFALKTKPFMEPRFKEGSLIIVDPEPQYSDGDYIVVVIGNEFPTVRKVIEEGGVFILKALNEGFSSSVLDGKNDRYLGKIIECRIEY